MYLPDGTRYDYSNLEKDIERGYTVTVRPANVLELENMDAVLTELKRKGTI
jgi:hypothetical protein